MRAQPLSSKAFQFGCRVVSQLITVAFLKPYSLRAFEYLQAFSKGQSHFVLVLDASGVKQRVGTQMRQESRYDTHADKFHVQGPVCSSMLSFYSFQLVR